MKKSDITGEEEVLRKIHRSLQKNSFILQKKSFDFKILSSISKIYRKDIDNQMDFFHEELQTYFSTHSSPIFAYDIEEKDDKVVCFCGIELLSDLQYRLYFKIAKNMFRRNNSNDLLNSLIVKTLRNLESNIVIAHGTNQKEHQYAQKSNKELVNTESLTRLSTHAKKDLYRLSGSGLHHFEEKIGYKRIACSFFKHGWKWFSSFNAMEWSFRNFIMKEDQRICTDCEKPQDVLLYCLEDAIVALFAYIWYTNHENDIVEKSENESQTGILSS